MSLFLSECGNCGSKEHSTGDCPHGLFSSGCACCGSKNHATSNCPHGLLSSKCASCGSTDHSTDRCPHGLFSTKCGHCGSKNHSTNECPHRLLSSKCGSCGSTDHATTECPHAFFGSRDDSSSRSNVSAEASPSSSADYSGSGQDFGTDIAKFLLGWIGVVFAGMFLIGTVAIWIIAPAVAGIVAFLHAPSLARKLASSSLPAPEAINRRKGRPYFRLPRGSISRGLTSELPLYLPLAAGVLVVGLVALFWWWKNPMLSAIYFAAAILGSVLSHFFSRRMYLWRLNALLLERRGIDTGNAGTFALICHVASIAVTALTATLFITSAVKGGSSRGSRSNDPSRLPSSATVQATSPSKSNREHPAFGARSAATPSAQRNPPHPKGIVENYHCQNCSTLIQSRSAPSRSACPDATFHNWTKLGPVGEINYQCKKCGTLVKVSRKPLISGCSKAAFHQWTKL